MPAPRAVDFDAAAPSPDALTDMYRSAVELATKASQTNDAQMRQQAREIFEAALAVSHNEAETIKITINLAYLDTQDGHPEHAIARLEAITSGAEDREPGLWSPEGARALDSLATAYLNAGQPKKAGDSYRKAVSVLERLGSKLRPDQRQEARRIYTNTAGAILKDERVAKHPSDRSPEKQMSDALGAAFNLLSVDDAPYDQGYTYLLRGLSCLRQAAPLRASRPQSNAREREELLSNAKDDFGKARSYFEPDWDDWIEATRNLAAVNHDLGLILIRSPYKETQEEGIDHLRSEATLHLEAYAALKATEIAARDEIRHDLGATLEALLKASPSPRDAWLAQSVSVKILPTDWKEKEPKFKKILAKSTWIVVKSVVLLSYRLFLLAIMGKTDQIGAEIAAFITSLNISEAESAPILTAVFKALGWSGRYTPSPQEKYFSLQPTTQAPQHPSLPTETYRGSPEASREGGGIAAYLERVWGHYEVLSRPDLRRIDPEAEMALRNWLRNPKHKPPNRPKILTKSEVVQNSLNDPEQVRAARRIMRALERHKL